MALIKIIQSKCVFLSFIASTNIPPRFFNNHGHNQNVTIQKPLENCTSPLDNVDFEDPRVVGSLLPLGLVCLMVILGNIMVIIAVRITHKLRGATNLFIGINMWSRRSAIERCPSL